MSIEEEIFKKAKVDLTKLIKYGFKKENETFKYSKNILHNTLRIDIYIDNKSNVKGNIYDLALNEEYINYRIENFNGEYALKVKNEFIKLLNDIKNKCFITQLFIFEQTNRIVKKIKEKYNDEPNFPWDKYVNYAAFKNKNTNKWYGLIMNIDKSKIAKNSKGEIEIINIKLPFKTIEELLKKDGYYLAYHMNKKNWISIILNDTISDEEILNLIDQSYSFTL